MGKKQSILFIIPAIVIISGVLIFTYGTQKNAQDTPKIIGDGFAPCLSAGGQWSEEFKECLGIDTATCENIGGKFNECASACRNDPKAEICTMQCVQVCEVK